MGYPVRWVGLQHDDTEMAHIGSKEVYAVTYGKREREEKKRKRRWKILLPYFPNSPLSKEYVK